MDNHIKLFDKIKKNKKWLIGIVLVFLVLSGAFWGGRSILYAIGEKEIYLAAQENAYCHDELCEEGKVRLIAMLERETGISSDLVAWCMAANAFYTTNFGIMNKLLIKFSDWMYQFCGRDDVTLEDAVLSIGEPE